jgi:hypothetical protein
MLSTLFGRAALALSLCLGASGALAQGMQEAPLMPPAVSDSDGGAPFPRDAMRFLDKEVPAMNQAVAAGDRAFFHDSMARMVAFSDSWGFKTRTNPALESYPGCTSAVEDYLVVGLCKLVPGGEDCTPQLASGFERNLGACRQAAR